MKYVFEEFVDEEDIASADGQGYVINVQFCRDCPLFEPYPEQEDSLVLHGWCRRMSNYIVFDDECPHYVDVNSNSFCNEEDISTEDIW